MMCGSSGGVGGGMAARGWKCQERVVDSRGGSGVDLEDPVQCVHQKATNNEYLSLFISPGPILVSHTALPAKPRRSAREAIYRNCLLFQKQAVKKLVLVLFKGMGPQRVALLTPRRGDLR